MALTCKVCERPGVDCICKPTLKKVIMQLQHSKDIVYLEDTLRGMQTIGGYIAGYIVAEPNGEDYTLQLLFDIYVEGSKILPGQRLVYIAE